MGGSQSQPVTIDITKRPGNGGGIQTDEKGGYFYNSTGGTVYLIEEWYPDPEGIYIKVTHTPESNAKISKINRGGINQTLPPGNLSGYPSVSVYYWSDDNTFINPLLIQLGDGNEYFKHTGSDTWTKDPEATSNLRDSLNKQNCGRNNAHIVDTSKKGRHGGTSYRCLSGCPKQITVSYSSITSTTYSIHTIPGPGSISSFKSVSTYQAGLPSLKDVKSIKVIWKTSGETPLLVYKPQTGSNRFFRKNKEDGNAWITVSNAGALSTGEPPNLALDLSKSFGQYHDGVGDITITVRSSHIGDGYYRFQYSFGGGLFKATEIKHGTALEGIQSSSYTLYSITAYYSGKGPLDLDNILLVELVIKNNQTTYKYFHRQAKDTKLWSLYPITEGETTRLQGKDLIDKLGELRKIQFPDPPKSIGDRILDIITSHYDKISGGLATAGLGGLGIWKGPAIVRGVATTLITSV